MPQRALHRKLTAFLAATFLFITAFAGIAFFVTHNSGTASAATRVQKVVKVPADKENCLECHTEKKKMKMDVVGKEKPSTYLSPELILQTAHATLSCVDCHKGYTRAIERKNVSRFGKAEVKVLHSEQEYRNYTQVATEACGDAKCHKDEQDEFLAGSHSQKITKTDKDLPTCTTCHNFHYIPRLFRDKKGKPIKLTAQTKIDVAVALCGSCHVKDLNTYTGNYHYKALRLGNADAPMCYDCHDGHKSARLTSGTPEAVRNCKKCHENASKDFTKYVVHLDPIALTAPPEVLYTNFFYTVMIVGIFAAVILHTLIQGSRKRKERKIEEQKEWDRLQREQDGE